MKGAPTPWHPKTKARLGQVSAPLVRMLNIEQRTGVPGATEMTAPAKNVIRLNPSPFEALVNPTPVVPRKVLREDCGCFEDDEATEFESLEGG